MCSDKSDSCAVILESGSVRKEYRVKVLDFNLAHRIMQDSPKELRKQFKKSKLFKDENLAISYAEGLDSDYGSLFLNMEEDF